MHTTYCLIAIAIISKITQDRKLKCENYTATMPDFIETEENG